MKIIIISYIYPNRLDQRLGIFVRQQCKYLAKEGHEVHVLTSGSFQDKKEEFVDGTIVHRLISIDNKFPLKGLLFSLRCAKAIISLNNRLNFDFVIQNFIGINTILIGIVTKLLNKRFIAISHGTGWELPKKNFIKNFIIKIVLSIPDKIVCVSKKTENLLSHNAKKNKLVVINNGMDPQWLKPSINKAKFRKKLGFVNKFIILSVSSLVPKKGIDVVIKILPELITKYPNLIYIIIGDGSEKENLKMLVNKLGLGKNVKFLGYKVGTELANYYNICDIFILMSRDLKYAIESFGIAYIEASYFGKPVIGGKSGGTADSILDNITGYRIKPTNTKEIVKKLLLLIKNDNLRKKLGRNGKKWVSNNLLWSHNVDKLMHVYKSLLNK